MMLIFVTLVLITEYVMNKLKRLRDVKGIICEGPSDPISGHVTVHFYCLVVKVLDRF